MLSILKQHKTPIIASGVGLFLVFLLGVAPLMKSTEVVAPTAKQVETAAVQNTVPTTASAPRSNLEARLTALENDLTGRISNLELKVDILNKAVGRMNVKLASQIQKGPAIDKNVTGIDRLNKQVGILNKAVGRMNLKLFARIQQSDETKKVNKNSVAGIERLDNQVNILNKAVTQLHKRYMSVSNGVNTQSEQLERLVKFEENLSALLKGSVSN